VAEAARYLGRPGDPFDQRRPGEVGELDGLEAAPSRLNLLIPGAQAGAARPTYPGSGCRVDMEMVVSSLSDLPAYATYSVDVSAGAPCSTESLSPR
jgi:hypothetical protein